MAPTLPRILPGDLDDPRVLDLVRAHTGRATAETARGSAHALNGSGLRHPDVAFWTTWDRDTPVCMGAWKRLTADHAEVQ